MVRLNKPELQQFLEEEVSTGRFASVDAAIEAAVYRMKWDEDHIEPLDEETQAAIDEADAQIARGEYYTVDQVRAMFAELKAKRA